MSWLNYHHLHYFWVIVQEGGLAKAALKLRLSHSTLSAQLRALETALGSQLFERRGRRLVLTPFGTEVASYASDIFRLGGELIDVAQGRSAIRRTPLRVGVVGSLPKTVVHRLLEPGMSRSQSPIDVRQDTMTHLLEELAGNRLHLVLADAPAPESLPLRVHSHLLGEAALSIYGAPELAARHRPRFPKSLDGAPLLLPGQGSLLRRALERWFADHDLRPSIEGEFDDAGLLRVFGGAGHGLFPVRDILRGEVEDVHGSVFVGPLDGLKERYYAISVERKVRHPGVVAIIESARSKLFAAPPSNKRARRRRPS
jgi:LysR family transcriptional activator of nhaA